MSCIFHSSAVSCDKYSSSSSREKSCFTDLCRKSFRSIRHQLSCRHTEKECCFSSCSDKYFLESRCRNNMRELQQDFRESASWFRERKLVEKMPAAQRRVLWVICEWSTYRRQSHCRWSMIRRDCKKMKLLITLTNWKHLISISRTSSSISHILIFNQQSQRDENVLLKSLFRVLQDISIQHVIFCTNKLSEEIAERSDIVDSEIFSMSVADVSHRFRESQ